MQNVLNRLHELEISARKIILIVEHLKSENAHLKEENARLKQEIDNESELESSMSVKTDVDFKNTWKDQIKEELDNYLEEIDQCIELLQK